MDYSENDLLLRLIEPLYDVSWAYHMSSTVDHVAKRIDRRRKTFSSTATVVSMATAVSSKTETSLASSALTIQDKVSDFETMLHRVSKVMRARQFEDVCRVSLKSSDDLYPGFRDVLFIAQYLMERTEPYMGQLTSDEINGLTLTQIFQYIYYAFCEFLLSGKRLGREAIKLIITPTKITHAAYDLCRQKFARLLYEETDFVQNGLLRLVRRIRKDRDVGDENSTKQSPAKTADLPPAPAVSNLPADAPADVSVKTSPNKIAPPPVAEDFDNAATQTPPPTTLPSQPRTPTKPSRRKSLASVSVMPRTLFPTIDLSSDDESGEDDDYSASSVSSLDSD